MSKLNIITVCGILLCAGCSPSPDTIMNTSTPVTTNSRIAVTRIGIIEDPLAYGDRRGIYLIFDTKTGKEYVGISGIGVSELGIHNVGKSNYARDER